MALNEAFNSSINTSEAMGNISLLDPNYTGINWVRDNAMSVTGGDGASYILFGLLVALFFVFVSAPNVSRYSAGIVSTFSTFLIGVSFWFWGFLPSSQVFILFILFILFVLSAVALYTRAKDEKESIQL